MFDFVNKKLKKISDIEPNFNKRLDIGSIDLSHNELNDVEGLPETIRGSLYAKSNKITSLKGIPKKVLGGIYLNNNSLTDLEFMLEDTYYSIVINNNKLTSLNGCPKHIGELLWMVI